MSEHVQAERVRHVLLRAPGLLDDEAVRSVEDIDLARVRKPSETRAQRPLIVGGVPGGELTG